ncbi:MAG TPA: hypothetical protein DER64_13635 [Planctomycetaceae bacterium]|nr:hypothetical protein [Planctomycetaceae bacterium]
MIEIGGEFFAWSSATDGSGYERKKLDVVKSEKGDARVLTDSKFIAVNSGVAENELVVLNPRDTVAEAKELILADEEQQAKKRSSAVVAKANTGAPGQGAGKGAKKKSGRPSAGGRKAAGGGEGSGAAGGLGRMAGFDKDKDGKISKAESEGTYVANFFDALDGDKDGFVTGAEVAAAQAKRKASGGGGGGASGKKSAGGGGGSGFTGATLLTRWDKDSDGKVSKAELPETMQAGFDALDGDSDGFLDRAELDKMVAAMRARRSSGGGGQ